MGNPWKMASKLYVDPDSAAASWCRQNPNDPRAAAISSSVASVPTALWVGPGQVHDWVAGYVRAAAGQQALPVLVLYAIPDRDLGQYSAGGLATAGDYRAWIDQVVSAVGDSPCVVLLEPDSLIHCVDQATTFRMQRFAMLQYGVAQFAVHCPNAAVYLDGGDAYYNKPATMAPLLVQAGVQIAAGFSLGVCQFNTVSTLTNFAVALNGELAKCGVPMRSWVGDVSRNGNGRPAQSWINAHPSNWMINPPGMRLGQRPTMTGLLWIKGPGVSDGPVGIVSGVDSGVFDPRLAIALITGASTA